MTYLELVKATRLVSGIQGTGPSSVEDATGIEELLALFVKDALIDIMSMKNDNDYLRASETFSTEATVYEYPFLKVFDTPTPDFKSYIPTTFRIAGADGIKYDLREVDYDNLQYQTRDSDDRPAYFAIRPSDKALILYPTPDIPYTVYLDYYKAPQILSVDTDVPLIPLAFHQLIVYKAVEKVSIYLAQPEIYRAYSAEAAKMLGQLMREERKPMKWRGRPIVGNNRRFY